MTVQPWDRTEAVEMVLQRLDLAGVLAALQPLTGPAQKIEFAEVIRYGIIAEVLDLAVDAVVHRGDTSAEEAAGGFWDRLRLVLDAPTDAAWWVGFGRPTLPTLPSFRYSWERQ